jgi:hypothetical protein
MTAVQQLRTVLPRTRQDLDDATDALSHVWVSDDHDSIARLTNATEALLRATSSLTLALERLAQYVDAIDVEV